MCDKISFYKQHFQMMERGAFIIDTADSQLLVAVEPTWQYPRRERGLHITPSIQKQIKMCNIAQSRQTKTLKWRKVGPQNDAI